MTTVWTERRVDDVIVIDIVGGLTVGKQEIREQFTELYERGEKSVLVNLAGVTYMDSTSVGDLIVAHLQAKENDASFKLLNMNERIIELLTMHHLIQVFEHYDDEDTAIASFAS